MPRSLPTSNTSSNPDAPYYYCNFVSYHPGCALLLPAVRVNHVRHRFY